VVFWFEGILDLSKEKGVFVQKGYFRKSGVFGDAGWRLKALGRKGWQNQTR
jgi:hypothetical protein